MDLSDLSGDDPVPDNDKFAYICSGCGSDTTDDSFKTRCHECNHECCVNCVERKAEIDPGRITLRDKTRSLFLCPRCGTNVGEPWRWY